MHKCKNQSVANVYHLEQLVGEFFPYSEKSLGFDKDVTIIFQSDQGNSSKMLGKTAYYDPTNYEVVLYVDGRHPKDVMRSLSHELVHHAQNCRGDFTGQRATDPGYAQRDPHLRKMEREAYTKGNLIFRDFEDLIKTGKKEVDIDFSRAGEPKMSLNEWKNKELNTLLMKKWGLLKEEKNEPADVEEADDELAGEEAGEDAAEELEEGVFDTIGNVASRVGAFGQESKNSEYWRRKGEQEAVDWLEKIYGHRDLNRNTKKRIIRQARKDFLKGDDASRNAVTDAVKAAVKGGDKRKADDDAARSAYQTKEKARLKDIEDRERERKDQDRRQSKADMDKFAKQRKSRGAPGQSWSDVHNTAFSHKLEEEDAAYRDEDEDASVSRASKPGRHVYGSHPDLADFIQPNAPEGEPPGEGKRVTDPRHLKRKTLKVPPVNVREGKISVREAKEITRRIIERLKKEGK